MKTALESNFGSYSSSCTRKYEMKGKNYGMSGDKLEARTRIGGKSLLCHVLLHNAEMPVKDSAWMTIFSYNTVFIRPWGFGEALWKY